MRFAFLVLTTILSGAQAAENTLEYKTTHKEQRYRIEKVLDGLSSPWSMAFLPNGGMLITEKQGIMKKIDNQEVITIENLPVNIFSEGQGGLMDVILHPDFATNRQLFFSYAAVDSDGKSGTEVIAATLRKNKLEAKRVIFRAQPKVNSGHHFGSKLLFVAPDYLYITLGDRGMRDHAQDLSNHLGTLIRIRTNTDIPNPNLFFPDKGAKKEILSYGHRNIQGIAYDAFLDQIWIHEHGPNGGDELNLVKPGKNYGWPVITYGREYITSVKIGEGVEKAGIESPQHYWVPSIAPSGMLVYDGSVFPQWRGNLFVGSLKFGFVVRLSVKNGTVSESERIFLESSRSRRVRDVAQGPDGYIYILDERNGELLRIIPD